MNPVVHFEMPYDAADRMVKFYKAAFGWKMKNMGVKMGNYVLATTTETSANGRPKKGGTINCGFYTRTPDWPEQHPSVVIAVDDLVRAMNKVTKAGGRVLGEPMDIPGVGGYVSFMDSEGNRVSMLQPMAMAKSKPKSKKTRPAAKKKARKT
jgi:predicted enzyme related to lactoylglutathione lyase